MLPRPRPKKIVEGDVPRSVIHSCSGKASLKRKTDPYNFRLLDHFYVFQDDNFPTVVLLVNVGIIFILKH